MADSSSGNLRYTLDLARARVHKGEAPQALAHLKSVQFEIDDLVGSSFWAEYQITYAGALAGMKCYDEAEMAFEEALERCAKLSSPDLPLEMTAQADYAKCLAEHRARQRARQHYQQAEKIADGLDREECVAHFQMCVIGLDLVDSKSAHLSAFQRLKEAAKEGYTEIEQRDAWMDYMEAPQPTETRQGKPASTDYFRGALAAIRRRRK